jgi:hypothetical protein
MSEILYKSLKSIDEDTLNGSGINNRDFARKILNYPAMMVPNVQEAIMDHLISEIGGEVSLFDPFMGAANTLVTGMRYGVNIYGQDINPLAVLISQVKTTIYNIEELKAFSQEITEIIKVDKTNKVSVSFKNIDKWFKKEIQIELSVIRNAILSIPKVKIRKFFWVALAEVIRLCSNDRTSTFKMHIRTKEDIDNRKISAISSFVNLCNRSIEDIEDLYSYLENKNLIINGKYIHNASVKWGDSKKRIRTTKKFNLLVTSPPYGDNHTTVTYGQFSYLPLQWIPVDDIDSIGFNYLDVIQEIDRQSLGGVNKVDFKDIINKNFDISPSLKEYFEGFSEEEKFKARKVVNFVDDLSSTIDNIQKRMEKQSYMAWTIGNRNVNKKEVPNDSILIDLMKSKGVQLFTRLEREILNKRMPGKNNFSSTMDKEQILIFKIGM